jgi:molecular chaperone DnaK
VYQTEKNLAEHGSEVDAESRANIERALEKAKKALEGTDAAAMRSAQDELATSQHKLAEAMYARAAQHKTGEPGAGPAPGAAAGEAKKDDVVDADFEEVKD